MINVNIVLDTKLNVVLMNFVLQFADSNPADLSSDLNKMALSVNNDMPSNSTNNSTYRTTTKPSISHQGTGNSFLTIVQLVTMLPIIMPTVEKPPSAIQLHLLGPLK